ncbi:condensation domain-containing protein, partial [uncultured Shewanella sp.]|uniref:condensation domain-containing protein n=1 Tax=uncultured Shewanella sp. TaxID=173975 RepID=UPI00260D7A09
VVDTSSLTASQLDKQLTQWQGQFSLDENRLWRVVYLTGYEDGSARLCFMLHHLIIDAVSWRIIIDDMRLLLTGQVLSVKTSSYRQWVDTVNHYGEQNEEQRDYWQAQLDKAAKVDYSACSALAAHDTDNHTAHQTDYHLVWSQAVTAQLLHDAPKGYYTEINDLLLSALALALSRTFMTTEVAMTLEGHGREDIDTRIDTTRTVGWFTTMFPLALSLKAAVSDVIIATKEALRSIPDKGIGFGALGLATSELPR